MKKDLFVILGPTLVGIILGSIIFAAALPSSTLLHYNVVCYDSLSNVRVRETNVERLDFAGGSNNNSSRISFYARGKKIFVNGMACVVEREAN